MLEVQGTLTPENTGRDYAERTAAEATALLRDQNRVLELIARGAPLPETLEQLLHMIEQQSPGMLCSILLLDPDGVHVRHCAAPSLPASFMQAIDGEPIGPKAGSCGTAAYRGEAVVVEDIATDPLWEDYRAFALGYGLRACWSTPIFDAHRRVLGTFALYFREPATPDERHWQLIDIATHTAAIAIAAHREDEALRSSEERLRLAVTSGNVGTWEWDIVTHRLTWNDQMKAMFGWANDEPVTSERFDSVVHPADRDVVNAAVERAIAEHGDYDGEYRITRPDGSVRWIAARGRAEYDETGQPLRLLGVSRDVTEWKQRDEEINRRGAQLAEAQRIAHLGSYEWDVRSNVVHRSEELCRIFGVSLAEFEPTFEAYLQRVHPDDRAATRATIERAYGAVAPFDFEERIIRPDGDIRILHSQGRWIRDDAGQPLRLVGICHDITERRLAEDQLRRSDERALQILEQKVAARTAELQAKNGELEQEIGERNRIAALLRVRNDELKGFAYTVSHDLKAPLRGIAGYARELERHHSTVLADRAAFCLQQILTATGNLDRLIEDLLHYSRLDAETATATDVDLARLVQGLLGDRRPMLLEQGVVVDIELAVTRVCTWERGLFQVLSNLIDNALKYSRHAEPPRVRITSRELPDGVEIVIADNGVGFDMKYHDRIYQLFNRLVRQEDFEGTGAGLAIAKKVLEKLGGRIRAESSPGAGARFYVELPGNGRAGAVA